VYCINVSFVGPGLSRQVSSPDEGNSQACFCLECCALHTASDLLRRPPLLVGAVGALFSKCALERDMRMFLAIQVCPHV
jgi:hypothetical protein